MSKNLLEISPEALNFSDDPEIEETHNEGCKRFEKFNKTSL